MTDDDDDLVERVKLVARLMRGIYEDRVIAASEIVLEGVPALQQFPDPMTCHPAFTHAMDFVRKFDHDHVKVHMVKRSQLFTALENPLEALPPLEVVILHRTKVWDLAPYVGDPLLNEAVYVWSVWVDDYKRHISGDSELVWRYPEREK